MLAYIPPLQSQHGLGTISWIPLSYCAPSISPSTGPPGHHGSWGKRGEERREGGREGGREERREGGREERREWRKGKGEERQRKGRERKEEKKDGEEGRKRNIEKKMRIERQIMASIHHTLLDHRQTQTTQGISHYTMR